MADQPRQPPSDGPPRRFLVVDDDEVFRTRLLKALQARGIEAHGAGDAEAALDLAMKVQPQAAIVDMRMPGSSGLELVSELKTRLTGIKVVVLTGYGSIATAVEA